MKDASTAIRTAFVDALSGLTYNSTPVPVTDGKMEDDDVTMWVIIGEQSSRDTSNKNQFATEEVIIVNKTLSVAGKKPVETVANSILGTILPSPSSHGLTIDDDFKIVYVINDNGRSSAVSQGLAAQFDNVKTLNFSIRITQ
jgi:hypothetical protein